ncbi:MAG TPA: CHAP domain-containing protein [Candidatus Dormibacteraeota bacterium]|jgi:surface antigen|nr:CHAP domain-containing protein [Candidatus Dormibacteraeota bacterium]
MTHAVLLAAVLTVPGLGAVLTGHPAEGLSMATAFAASPTRVTGAESSRGFIVKPVVSTSVAPPERRQPIVYSVQQGDVLGAIADKYGLRLDTLRYSNNLADVDALQIGQQLLIPPTNGVLVRVTSGDTVQNLSDHYHIDAATIVEFNLIRDPVHLPVGALVMLPDGTGTTTPQLDTVQTGTSTATPPVSRGIAYGRSSYNHFPWGQCTYWVAANRNIPWNGNAWQWFGAAQSYGYATGRSPRVGAIMVTWESRYYGHVALVEAVYDDGSWLVSEMNYRGLGIVDHRRIYYGQVPLIGFIY